MLASWDHRNGTILFTRRAWQAGLTLSQAWKRVSDRCPDATKREVIAEWRDLRGRFGCGSAPISHVEMWK